MNNQLLFDYGLPSVGLALAAVSLLAVRIMSWNFHRRFPDAVRPSKTIKEAEAAVQVDTPDRGTDKKAESELSQTNAIVEHLRSTALALERGQGLQVAERNVGIFTIFPPSSGTSEGIPTPLHSSLFNEAVQPSLVTEHVFLPRLDPNDWPSFLMRQEANKLAPGTPNATIRKDQPEEATVRHKQSAYDGVIGDPAVGKTSHVIEQVIIQKAVEPDLFADHPDPAPSDPTLDQVRHSHGEL